MGLGSIVSGFEKKADKIRRAANKQRKAIQDAANRAQQESRRAVQAGLRVPPRVVDPLSGVSDATLQAAKHPFRTYERGSVAVGDKVVDLAGKGLHEYDTRIQSPAIALTKQLTDAAGPAGSAIFLPFGVKRLYDTGFNPEPKLPEDGFINPIKATYNEEEQVKAKEIVDQLDPVTKTLAYLAIDPANLLPVVGFGPELSTLLRAVKAGGPSSVEALRVITSNPKLKEEFVVGMKRILLEERGAIKLGGAADEGADAARLAKLGQQRVEADAIQNVLDFGQKQRLNKLGIDPNAIDQPEVMARVLREAPELLDESPEFAAYAQRVGESLIEPKSVSEGLDVFDQEAFDSALDGLELPRLGKKQPKRPTDYSGLVSHQDDVQSRIDELTERLDELDNPDTVKGEKLQEQIDELEEYLGEVEGMADEFSPENFVTLQDELVTAARSVTEEAPLPAQGVVPYVPGGKLAVVAPRAAEGVSEVAARPRLIDEVIASGALNESPIAKAEEAIQLPTRSFTSRAKEYAAASSQDEIRNLIREEGEIKRKLAQGVTGEEAQSLHDALSLLSVQKKTIRDDIETAAKAAQDTAEAATKRRALVRANAAAAAKQKITRSSGFSHQRITDPIPLLEDVLTTAFGPNTWQRKAAGALARVVGSPIKKIDKSLIHENSFVGKYYVAFQQLDEIAESNRELGMRALRGYGDGKGVKVFDLTEDGIEATTGKELSDVLSNWDTYKHLFGDEQKGFVDLYRRFHSDVLEDAKRLGVSIPDAWRDTMHIWRQVRGKKGVDFQNALQSGARGTTPGSFKHRIYETIEAGRAAGIDYNKDFMQVVEAGAMSITHHATHKAFWNAMTKKAPLFSRWVPAELKAQRAVAAKEYIWARQVKNYVHESLRGRPPQPILRDITGQDVPKYLRELVGEVAHINATKLGRARSDLVRPYTSQIDNIVERTRTTHRAKNTRVRSALRDLNKKLVSGEPFGLQGLVEVGAAPPSKFPALQNRLFLKDDLEYLIKTWETDQHKWLGGAAATSDVFRAGTTALDPGFWFVQGLGAVGTDVANAARGKPTAIWGKSAWRSLRNVVTNGKSANRYWARELRLHPEEVSEFAQHYRSLTGHAMPSEFTAAMEKGGLIEKLEHAIPGVKQAQPFTRANNAFSFYLDSFAWETWKSLKPLAKDDPAKLVELGQFVRNITGKTSTRGLGHSQMQRLAERAFVAWAPAYTRGSFAIMGKALLDPTSFGGRQALKSLAGLAAASTLLGGALIMSKQLNKTDGNLSKLDWDEMGDEMTSFWDVTNPSKFMSVRMGDNNFGVGGAMRANVAMMSRLANAGYSDPTNYSPLDIEGGKLLNFDHPFLRAWRAKTSPLTGQAFNLLTGEDYLGFQLDDPAQYFRLSEDITPFALQAYLHAEGGLKGKAGAGVAEWFGFRSFPIRKVDLYHEAAERETGDSWEDLDAAGQLSLMRDNPDQFPETAQRWEEYQTELRAKGSLTQTARDTAAKDRATRDEALGTLAGNIQWGRPGGGEWYKKQHSEIKATYRRSYDVAAAALGVDLNDMEKSEAKDELLRSQYYELNLEDYMGPDNKPDWDAFKAAKKELFDQLTPLAQQAVTAKKLDFDNPTAVDAEKRRMQAGEDLNTWFDYPKYKGLTVEESDKVDALLEEASKIKELAATQGKSIDRRDILKAMASSGTRDPKLASIALILTYTALADTVKSPASDQWALSHPDLAVFYPFVFDSLSEDQQLEWTRLHSFRK